MSKVSRPAALIPISTNESYNSNTCKLFFAASWLAIIFYVRNRRLKSGLDKLLEIVKTDRARINPAMRDLTEMLVDVANASAISGDSEYMLAKRLNRILSSPRGEGRTVRNAFMTISDGYESGLMSWLRQSFPELSRSEIALCGLMTVGLDPGCICKVLGYEHEQTFYNKRTEIRRKLSLDRSESLEGFLQNKILELRRLHDEALTAVSKV